MVDEAPDGVINAPAQSGLTIPVSWAVDGTPPANFSHFEVEYNSGSGWTTWLSNTTDNSTTFVGADQDQISFQVRAVTQLGNEGTWATTTAATQVGSVTKYYYHGSSRVAMRQGSEVSFLHGDHLGSTSLTTDDTGSVIQALSCICLVLVWADVTNVGKDRLAIAHPLVGS